MYCKNILSIVDAMSTPDFHQEFLVHTGLYSDIAKTIVQYAEYWSTYRSVLDRMNISMYEAADGELLLYSYAVHPSKYGSFSKFEAAMKRAIGSSLRCKVSDSLNEKEVRLYDYADDKPMTVSGELCKVAIDYLCGTDIATILKRYSADTVSYFSGRPNTDVFQVFSIESIHKQIFSLRNEEHDVLAKLDSKHKAELDKLRAVQKTEYMAIVNEYKAKYNELEAKLDKLKAS